MSYAAFLVVGLVIAYAFLGIQFSGQIAGKEAELGSLRQANSGLQGELEAARATQSPSQQVLQLDTCTEQKAQIASLQAQLAAAKEGLAQCNAPAGAAAVSPTATASTGFVGKTISVSKDESIELGDGVALAYFGTDANAFAVFRINGVSYTRAVGSFTSVASSIDGSKYVVTVNAASMEKGEFVFYNG